MDERDYKAMNKINDMKKKTEEQEPEYVPFSEEWKSYVMTLPKRVIVEMYSSVCKELQKLKYPEMI